MVLHGLGDTHEGWSWLPEALRLPWLNYCLVDAPDAYFGGFSWYDFAGDSGAGIRRSRELLHALLKERASQGWAPAETGLLGFSQGCLMALDAGLRFSPPLRAIVGISGYVWEPEVLAREMIPPAGRPPVLMTHGTRDPLLPIAAVRRQVAALNAAGAGVEWREFDKVHTVAGEPELELIRAFLARAFTRS